MSAEPTSSPAAVGDPEILPGARRVVLRGVAIPPLPWRRAGSGGAEAPPWSRTRAGRIALGLGRVVVAYAAALVIFAAFAVARGVDPWSMYSSMLDTLTSDYGVGQLLDKAAPFALAAAAVAVPARAGLVNIGGEGQLVMGATAAGVVGLWLGTSVTGVPAVLVLAAAGAATGAAWAGIAALLKLVANVNEAVSTLLLNYVGADLLSYLVYGPLKDTAGNGQPVSKAVPGGDMLPLLPGTQAHVGPIIALAVIAAVAIILARTRFGFALRVIGGNREAARRAGLPVPALLLSAMLLGGALAGLGGMLHYSTLEGQLRPGLAATFGYTGFLASWLGQHSLPRVTVAAALLAAIAVGGDSLQITTGLPGATVDILLATILLAVLALRPRTANA